MWSAHSLAVRLRPATSHAFTAHEAGSTSHTVIGSPPTTTSVPPAMRRGNTFCSLLTGKRSLNGWRLAGSYNRNHPALAPTVPTAIVGPPQPQSRANGV